MKLGKGCMVYGLVMLALLALMFLGTFLGTGIASVLPEKTGETAFLASAGLSGLAGMAFGLMWLGGSLPGFAVLAQKKYLAQFAGAFTRAGCALILFGWWIPLVLMGLALMLGPIWWLIASSLKPRRECPACKQIIAGDASRCPHCAAEVTPAVI